MADTLTATFSITHPLGPTIHSSLEMPALRHSVAVLLGPSGCGKTTVLRCLAGLDRPDQGRIQFANQVWFESESKTHLTPQQRGIGLVFQDYALFPHLTVAENIAYGLDSQPKSERTSRVDDMIQRFNLTEQRDRRPRQISGGQQQRVALARTLITKPRLLLLDEPLSALDTSLRHELRAALHHHLKQLDIPVILVTHDQSEAEILGDQWIVMNPSAAPRE